MLLACLASVLQSSTAAAEPRPTKLFVFSLAQTSLEESREQRIALRLKLTLDRATVDILSPPLAGFATQSAEERLAVLAPFFRQRQALAVVWIEPLVAGRIALSMVVAPADELVARRVEAPEVVGADSDLALMVREFLEQTALSADAPPAPAGQPTGPATTQAAAPTEPARASRGYSSTLSLGVGPVVGWLGGSDHPRGISSRFSWQFRADESLGVGVALFGQVDAETRLAASRYSSRSVGAAGEAALRAELDGWALESFAFFGADWSQQEITAAGRKARHGGGSTLFGGGARAWISLRNRLEVGAEITVTVRQQVVEFRFRGDRRLAYSQPHTSLGFAVVGRVSP